MVATSVKVSLDDLYLMTARMYQNRNEERSVAATANHFVEMCAALTGPARTKHRDELDVADALCKALGWFFPLMAKLRVRSLEELIFLKYPSVCPYCRQSPHKEAICKTVRGTESTVDHSALGEAQRQHAGRRPVTLEEWRQMFDNIYPRSLPDVTNGRSALGLFEELGELLEAVRVFDRYPKYLAGEAADVFSYLMGFASEHVLHEASRGREFDLEHEFLRRYPGMCRQCGFHICVCPPIPQSTVGRLAKELDIDTGANGLLSLHPDVMSERATRVAGLVVDRLGGYLSVLERHTALPVDRGEANRSLVQFCLLLADRLDGDTQPGTAAASLRSAAFRAVSAESAAGTTDNYDAVEAILSELRSNEVVRAEAEKGPFMTLGSDGEGAHLSARWRVLLASAGPADEARLDVGREAREIEEAVRRGSQRDQLKLKPIQATRLADLRRALLEDDYDLLHLSGHGTSAGPVLEGDNGESVPLSLNQLRALVTMSPSVKCVLLNSCFSTVEITEPVGPITIGLQEAISDRAAIAFATGFYDALAAGRDLKRAYLEGRFAASSGGESDPNIVYLQAAETSEEGTATGSPVLSETPPQSDSVL